MTITSTDITRQVTESIEASGDPTLTSSIDVTGIVGEIIQRYGLVDIDTIDHDEYWALVQRHDATQH